MKSLLKYNLLQKNKISSFMKSKSKFSLILPVYNEEKILEQSLNQILKLQLDDKDLFEIIIVNDGSSDQTPKILKKFKQHDNLKIIDHKKNFGYGTRKN